MRDFIIQTGKWRRRNTFEVFDHLRPGVKHHSFQCHRSIDFAAELVDLPNFGCNTFDSVLEYSTSNEHVQRH